MQRGGRCVMLTDVQVLIESGSTATYLGINLPFWMDVSLRRKLIPGLRAMVCFYTNRPNPYLDTLSWVRKGRNSQVLACHHSLPIFSNHNCPSIQFTFIAVSQLFHVFLSQCYDRNWLVCSPGSDTVACCLLLLITIDFFDTSLKKSMAREEEKWVLIHKKHIIMPQSRPQFWPWGEQPIRRKALNR